MYRNLRRITITMIVAAMAIMGTATISLSQLYGPFRSVEECEIKMQERRNELLRLGYSSFVYKCFTQEGFDPKSFEKNISGLSTGERIATIKIVSRELALAYGWTKQRKLSVLNSRDVYMSRDGKFYSLDTQHGRWEKFDSKGKHLGEYDFGLHQQTKKPGTYKLRVK
jgi:hypothetical protein